MSESKFNVEWVTSAQITTRAKQLTAIVPPEAGAEVGDKILFERSIPS